MRALSIVCVLSACAGDGDPTDNGPTTTDTPTATTGDDTGTVEKKKKTTVPTSGNTWRLHEAYGTVAYVAWDQAVADDVHVEVSFDEGVWLSTPTKAVEAGRSEQVVLGIPYATTAEWRVVSDTSKGTGGDPVVTIEAKAPIVTADPPASLPLGTLIASDDSQWYSDGNYFLCSVNASRGGWTGGRFWTFIMDRQGRTVWARQAPMRHWTLYAQVALGGDHLLWDEATYWSNPGSGGASQVHRQYLDVDDPFESIATPGLHHAFVQLPDGTLAWGSKFHDSTEALVELAPGKTDAAVIWTCGDDWPGSGDCESNGLFYSPSRDTYLYSFYTNDSIVEVDRAKGSSRWWAGRVPGGFSFNPASSQVSWQHGISWTDAGTLLLSSDAFVDGEEVTLVREYTVDEKKGVLNEIWNYNPGILADTNGDAWRLPNGNTVHVVGSGAQVHEVTTKGELVWQVNFVEEGRLRLMGRGEYIRDLYALVSPAAK